MASIRKIENKDGLSYQFTVCAGRGANNRQIRHYKTYTPPATWSEQKAYKEAVKLAALFEDSVNQGYELDNRQTFAEYADYALELKLKQKKMRESTDELYRSLLSRILPAIGHMKLADIRPAHLNNLYIDLASNGGRSEGEKARFTVDLRKQLKEKGLSFEDATRLAGVSKATLGAAADKKLIRRDTAGKIAAMAGLEPGAAFKVQRNTKPLSDKTVLEHHRLISTILAQAEKVMLVPYNAASKASPPHAKRKDPNYFQPDEVTAILDAADGEPHKYRTFVYLLVVTGCRRGELAGLKWSQIDFNSGRITIDCSLNYSRKKGTYEGETKTSEQRNIKIPKETVELLRQQNQKQAVMRIDNGDRWEETGYVFTQDNGKPMNPATWTAWLNDFSERHGLRHINPHAFRHTAASVLISNGTDVVTVSKLLGHADVSTTEDIYAHMIDDAKDAASDTLTEVLLRRKA